MVTHDFFPYADDRYSYWTGFYTSRANLKILSRESDAMLRGAEIVHSFARALLLPPRPDAPHYVDLGPEVAVAFNESAAFQEIQVLREAAALVQHHDGVTGMVPRLLCDWNRQFLQCI